MKKEDVIKTLAVIIVPGGIPIYIGYKTYQFGKWIYEKRKEDEKKGNKKDEQDR